MGRAIKFRVFFYDGQDLESGEMLTGSEAIHEDCITFDDHNVLRPQDESAVLMQYTNLKDKNGTEIYEDDVIKGVVDMIDLPIRAKIVFEQGYFGVLSPVSTESLPLYGINNIEVIGNIWENPELLQQENN